MNLRIIVKNVLPRRRCLKPKSIPVAPTLQVPPQTLPQSPKIPENYKLITSAVFLCFSEILPFLDTESNGIIHTILKSIQK